MHASGGIESGLGMLLVVVIAGTGLIRADRFALLFAALGSLAVLGEQLYTQFSFGYGETAYVQAGLLGATLFATAVLALGLAHRGRRIEAIAEQRAVDLANLATLNERVIQQMDSGLLFVDHDSQVHLANDSARELLGIGADQPLETLEKLCLPLASALARWRTQQGQPAKPISDPQLRVELQVSFTPLGTQGTLVHIEDHSFIKQQLQQLKLASIGRLTASIAHEIRNPLGAISHAAQLLDESPDLNFADKRLTQIVIANCRRMNAIVEDVLQLSRREKVERSEIPLREWLDQFVRDFCASERASPLQFEVRAHPTARCLMDPNHLHQVLWNLCSNALRHGGKPSIRILLRVEQLPRSRQTALDVLDNGKGITPEQAEEIFEPFVTSSHEGTGLGLYIARELCEFNGATLRLMPGAGGTHFRLIFSPPMDLDN
jgi:two-component system sensor histidine kinase PilS (NtrC family)